jgi:hypothetical protein
MDHINYETLDVADSKYYDFPDGMTEEAMRTAAARIADTVEKGRMVQAQLVRNRRIEQGLPLDDDLIWQVVSTRSVTIITPTGIPPRVMTLIKQLVGPRAAARLRFRVVEPQIDRWLSSAG